MDQSTENVTLLAVFLKDVISQVANAGVDTQPLAAIYQGHDLSNPYKHVPIDIYNKMCDWVEKTLGQDGVVQVGRKIGETVFQGLVENFIISEDSSPKEIMEGLIIAASSMVSDPKGRGWILVESNSKSLLMKRTQNFHSRLQLGLLCGLIEQSGKTGVSVTYEKSLEKGDEFDEYRVSWQ